MNKYFDEEKRNEIMGLGKNSIRKNYYRSLLEKQKALEEKNKALVLENIKREAAEKKLIELNKSLEVRIKERTLELETSNRQLKDTISNLEKSYEYLVEGEKIASLNHLVNGISHEIGTPLGVSITASSYLQNIMEKTKHKFFKDQLTKKDMEDLFETFDESSSILQRSIDKLTRLTNNFKRIAMVQDNHKLYKFSPYEYTNMIFENMQSQGQKYQNISLRNRSNPDLILVGYPGMYTQLLTIFIENSIIHGFEKKGGMITVEVALKDDHFRFNYKDDGKGMDDNLIAHVFEPFYTTQMSKERNGLGLFAAYNLITGVGGTIKCISSQDQGFEIEIKVPLDHKERSL